FGGADQAGLGNAGNAKATIELFDPTVGYGLWAALPSDPFAARAYANATALDSGVTLISGGIDGNGVTLASAGLVNPSGVIKLTAIPVPMAAARRGHAVAAAHFPDGDGAILFGGLGGATGPVAERLVGQNFSSYDVGML